ncbi:MAG: TonB-dependent receptor [Lutibacter sp.]|uniref:TonB-dependent receptor n=1 Tax=Lutibacter sp. TaxID=1925666 RepID=UPI00185DBA1F|nr:carboxypeptidase-like regulatory domain-containing protein [Lutibacter sp.]MBT8317715.1 TonB-dependent receptor [Lutibacter sp.]NNJ58573.1 TonB-dependent receptor [Lutibacter sp.]
MKLFYRNKFWLPLFIILFSSLKVNSQNSFSFLEELNLVENKFDVKFSYVISNIENIQLQEKISDISTLNEIITYINSQTFLIATKIDGRFISIAPKQENIEICGTIVDKNNIPINKASIIVSGKLYGSTSDENGIFYLKNLKISDNIKFQYLGNKSILKNVNELISPVSDCIKLTMVEEEIELNEVFIKNYIANSLSKLKDGTVQLDTKNFDILSGQVEPDLLQTSQILPGVESPNESISNINVRNGVSDQNVIFWDNIKMYNPTHFFGLISAVNPYLTKNISIIKNGTSAKYNDGVSSTMLLETDNALTQILKGGFGANFISYDGFITVPVNDKLNLKTSFRNSNNNWFNTPTYDSYFNKTFQNSAVGTSTSNSDFSFYDVNVSLLYNLNSNNNLKVNYIKINNDLNYYEVDGSNLADKIKQNSDAIGLTYNSKINSKLIAKISGYYTKYSLLSNNYQNNQQQLVIQENEVLENSIKTTLNYTFNNYFSLESGYQLNETGVLSRTNVDNPLYNRIQRSVMLNHSAFLESNYKDNRWFVRTGVRFNYFDKIDQTTIEPRINVNYSFDKNLSINTQFEAKSQYTSQVIDYLDDFLGVETRRWVMADENIPLIKSSQFSLGSTFKKSKLLIDLNFFYKNINGILISGQGFQNQIQNKRLDGEQKSTGIEVLLNQRSKKADFWLSYTLSNSDLLFKQINENYFPSNNDIRHSSTIGFNFHFNKRLNTSISGIIKSGRPFTTINTGQETKKDGNFTIVNYASLNKERLKAYSRVDFSINYLFLKTQTINSTVKFGILNVFNKEQILDSYYVVDQNDNSKATKINIKSLEFTPNISLRFAF